MSLKPIFYPNQKFKYFYVSNSLYGVSLSGAGFINYLLVISSYNASISLLYSIALYTFDTIFVYTVKFSVINISNKGYSSVELHITLKVMLLILLSLKVSCVTYYSCILLLNLNFAIVYNWYSIYYYCSYNIKYNTNIKNV